MPLLLTGRTNGSKPLLSAIGASLLAGAAGAVVALSPAVVLADASTESVRGSSGRATGAMSWGGPDVGVPLSGSIPDAALDGRSNHPLEAEPITNEHTAAMTMARADALDAYAAGRCVAAAAVVYL